MKLRKVMAMVVASALAVSAMAISAFAEDPADGEAYLAINRLGWTWDDEETGETIGTTSTNATVTGNGTYTVSFEADTAFAPEVFNALEIQNGEVLFGATYTVTITEIKIDGAAVAFAGDCYTCSKDGAGKTTRVNIYNAYNNPTEDSGDLCADVRCVDMDNAANTTARIIELPESMKTIEVTFEVAGIAASGDTDAAGTADKGNADTGVADVAAIAGLAIVAAGAIVVAKKRK